MAPKGIFEDRRKAVLTMVNATGLPAYETVPIDLKETTILCTIWGPSRHGRAKKFGFGILCASHRISPSLLIPHSHAT